MNNTALNHQTAPRQKQNPIGIFDSGVGGLTVLKEIQKRLPNESVIYFGDNHNCPYGEKLEAEANALAAKNIDFLVDRGCKLIVIACNTVTAISIDHFRARFNVPFVGMEPALKPAARVTKSKKIGVLATENTFNGNHFKRTFEQYGHTVEVMIQPGYGLVELVETNRASGKRALVLLKKYLYPMLDKGVDTIVLGCTHYPFLKENMARILPEDVRIIDPSDAVACQTERILRQHEMAQSEQRQPEYQYYTTGNRKAIEQFISHTMPFTLSVNHVRV